MSVTVTCTRATGSGVYNHVDFVYPVAQPEPGYHWTGWSFSSNLWAGGLGTTTPAFKTLAVGTGETAWITCEQEADPPATYNLQVNYGTGSVSGKNAGDICNFAAILPDGKVFDHWESADASLIDDVYAESTHIHMPSHNVEVIAIFSGDQQVILI